MNIIKIEEFEDGSAIATVADDAGNVIGQNYYSAESLPRPRLTGEGS